MQCMTLIRINVQIQVPSYQVVGVPLPHYFIGAESIISNNLRTGGLRKLRVNQKSAPGIRHKGGAAASKAMYVI